MYKCILVIPELNLYGVKMKLDKFKILSEANEKFGTSRFSKESISLSERCVDIAQDWLDDHKDNHETLINKDAQILQKQLKNYIRPRIVKYKKSKFIPTVVWWWIAQIVINWIIDRIIDYILKSH